MSPNGKIEITPLPELISIVTTFLPPIWMKFMLENNGKTEFSSIQELDELKAASDKLYDTDKPGVYCRSWTYTQYEWIHYFEDLLKKVQDGKIDGIDVSKLLLYIKRFLIFYKDVCTW
jgi:hypothetical protein